MYDFDQLIINSSRQFLKGLSLSHLEDRVLNSTARPTGSQEEDAKIKEIEDVIVKTLEFSAESVLNSIKHDPSVWTLDRRDQRNFAVAHEKVWKESVNYLDLFINVSTEAGLNLYSAFHSEAFQSEDAVFEALTRLFGRACQVSRAIHSLLRSGFADDAFARWRTLHEISIYSLFISKHGGKVATRFLDHGQIEEYRYAKDFKKYARQLNLDEPKQEEMDTRLELYDSLRREYGRSFSGPYGWAANIIEKPTIEKIAEDVELNHMRPINRLANYGIHTGPRSIYLPLSLNSEEQALLVGPSMIGISFPGVLTVSILHLITTTLLSTKLRFRDCVAMGVLERVRKEVENEFERAEERLEQLRKQEHRN